MMTFIGLSSARSAAHPSKPHRFDTSLIAHFEEKVNNFFAQI
jgi:hypothetical protein